MIEYFNFPNHVIMFIVTFILTLIIGPICIPILTKFKFGQTVRDDGPATHLVKTGTPTIGGIIFLIPLLVCSVFYSFINAKILALLFVTIGFGIIGLIDDVFKVKRKSKDGLNPKQKMLGLLIVAFSFSIYLVNANMGTDIIIPFLGTDITFNLAWIFIPFCVLVLISSTNAVNITDGLDGLAAGVTLIIAVFFTVVAMANSEWEYVKIFSSIVSGGCLGFLAFNLHPAKVFMGDTGSIALGGAIGAIAIVMKMPLLLIIVGFIYVVETFSVALQVVSFKLRGKRVFKMAPLHHHFELIGFKENKVVLLFWAITALCCFIGFLALRFKFY